MYEKFTTLALLAVAAFAQAPTPTAPATGDWTDIATQADYDAFDSNNIVSASLALWDESGNADLQDCIDNGDTNGFVFGIFIDYADAPADEDYVVVGTFVEGEDNSWGIVAGPGETI